MQRLKFITLSLVAAFAISAVASASAWAGPVWKKGGAELAAPVAFEATSGEGKLENDKGSTVTCTSDLATGKAEAPGKVSHVTVKFKGCKGPFNETCGVGGEIVSALLTGELVYLNAAHEKIGLLLKQNETTKEFANFKCGFGEVKVTGEVIGEITPPKVEATEGKLKYKQTAGEQEWHTIEGKAEPPDITLESEIFGSKAESALQSEDTVKWLPAGTEVGAF